MFSSGQIYFTVIKPLTILVSTLCLRYFSKEKKIVYLFPLKPVDEVDSLLVQLLSRRPDLAEDAELSQVQEDLHVVRRGAETRRKQISHRLRLTSILRA